MFGEFGVFCADTFVGVICDDTLYLKITNAGRNLVPDADEGPPYDGAKPYLVISDDVIEDAGRLSEVVGRTASELPAPKPKKARKSKKPAS